MGEIVKSNGWFMAYCVTPLLVMRRGRGCFAIDRELCFFPLLGVLSCCFTSASVEVWPSWSCARQS